MKGVSNAMMLRLLFFFIVSVAAMMQPAYPRVGHNIWTQLGAIKGITDESGTYEPVYQYYRGCRLLPYYYRIENIIMYQNATFGPVFTYDLVYAPFTDMIIPFIRHYINFTAVGLGIIAYYVISYLKMIYYESAAQPQR